MNELLLKELGFIPSTFREIRQLVEWVLVMMELLEEEET